MPENNTNKRYTKRDLENERWRGKVTESLTNITTTLTETNKKMGCLDKRLSGLQIKVAGIGASAALIVSILIAFLTKWLK